MSPYVLEFSWKRFLIKKPGERRCPFRGHLLLFMLLPLPLLFFQTGCQSPSHYRVTADRVANTIIQEKQEQVLGKAHEFSVERPSDTFRRRLLIEQGLPYASEASLGTDKLKTIEHWPEKDYPVTTSSHENVLPLQGKQPVTLSLMQALQVGARNSFEYQDYKEEIFQSALSLDLERNEFRSIFTGQVQSLYESDSSGKDTVRGMQNSAALGAGKTFKTGADVSAALALDLAHLLTQGGASSLGLLADATISIPLLRGSGRHIVTEPLTQAERNVVYAIYEFERFKQGFAVSIADQYLAVLEALNNAENAEKNYRNLTAVASRSRRLAEAGRLSEIQADQADQKELRARRRWISALESYKSSMDSFKASLGLPPDALIELDRAELEKLLASLSEESAQDAIGEKENKPTGETPADLTGPDRENAGLLGMNELRAIQLGLESRFDLRIFQGKVYDAQRAVAVSADALRAELTLFGSAQIGQSRTIETATLNNAKLRTNRGIYSSLLTLDLPLERTAERNAYRNSFIALERAVREVQKLEDRIKLNIRKQLRDMLESRERFTVQAKSMQVAEKRVKSVTLFLEAGRAQIRDLTDAQEDLLEAQNGLTEAVVDYRLAELEFQRDTGLLKIDEKGLWQEYTQREIKHDKH